MARSRPIAVVRSTRSSSISYCSIAVLAEVLPPPASRRSITTTSAPRLVNSKAMSAPVIPPPTTTTSHFSSTLRRPCTVGSPSRLGQNGVPSCKSMALHCPILNHLKRSEPPSSNLEPPFSYVDREPVIAWRFQSCNQVSEGEVGADSMSWFHVASDASASRPCASEVASADSASCLVANGPRRSIARLRFSSVSTLWVVTLYQ